MNSPTTLAELMEAEASRQAAQLSLIASENYASKAVLDALASPLTNKYSEGYPGRRYYGGNAIIDQIETEVIRLGQQLFHTDYHLNVQPYSGSPANLAAYAALLKPGDTVLAMGLSHGGHLTHGHTASFTSAIYHFVHYGVNRETELIDYDEVLSLAKQHRPKLIVCGATAYPALLDFTAFARIARESSSWLMVDLSHVAGLVAGQAHPSPFGVADVITTTTHKTLRGPRAAAIFCRPEFAKAIDRAVFPGLQGGPHLNTIAAMGVSFQEALQPSFTQYVRQVVANAQELAFGLQKRGYRLVADGTENHLFLLDLRGSGLLGAEAQDILEKAGIICNKNTIPFDEQPPANPSGLRIGTAAVTSRGMKEKEMTLLAELIAALLANPASHSEVSSQIGTLARKFRIPLHY